MTPHPDCTGVLRGLPTGTAFVYYVTSEDGELRYVGSTKNLWMRISQHRGRGTGGFDDQQVTVHWRTFNNMRDAQLEEKREIVRLRPPRNRVIDQAELWRSIAARM